MAGLFSVNMVQILNKTNSDSEEEGYSELIAATDVYLAINKEKLALLHNGESNKIKIPIKSLKDEGLISRDYSINGKKIRDDMSIVVILGDKGELEISIEKS